MTLTDLVLSLPIPRSVLRSAARALQPTRKSNATGRIGTLGLGMALGGGVALLCAPKSGRELRRQIFARLEGTGHVREGNEEARRHASTAGV